MVFHHIIDKFIGILPVQQTFSYEPSKFKYFLENLSGDSRSFDNAYVELCNILRRCNITRIVALYDIQDRMISHHFIWIS